MTQVSVELRWRLFEIRCRWRSWRLWLSGHPKPRTIQQCYVHALLGLPRLGRSVLLLHCLDNMPYPEIAHRLGIDTKSVETYLSGSLAHLDRALESCTEKLATPQSRDC